MTQYIKSKVDGTVVRDFARRTLTNLEFIEDHYYNVYRKGKGNTEVYEVTQMINSLLGLLVFPQQEFWDFIKPVPLTLSELSWLKIDQCGPGTCGNLKQLIRYVRNSISHFNVYFVKDKDYIKRMEMWNVDRKGETNWRAEIDVFDLREFAIYFIKGIIDGTLLEMAEGVS